MAIFSFIEHILHNHFPIFHCGLGFLNFFDFFMVVVVQICNFVGDGILGLIIEMIKEEISSN
jgi:hypothetical protein